MSTEQGSQYQSSTVYDQYSGCPTWASVAVRFVGYVFTALAVGLNAGQFIQITRYAEAGVVAFTSQTYLAEFTPGTVLGPLFGFGLAWVGRKYHEEIDAAVQPWLEFLTAVDSDDYRVEGSIAGDYAAFNKMVLKAAVPTLAVVLPLAVLAGSGGTLESLLNILTWPAFLVSGWVLWRELRRNPPESEFNEVLD